MPKTIACFGEVMMRLQVPGHDLLTQADTLRYSFSGTNVNVASALSRFGHTAHIVTTLPASPLGDAALAHIRKLGVATSLVRRGGRWLGMYFLETGFGPRPSRVTYANRAESSFNTAPSDAYDVESIVQAADVVHFCGISLAMNDVVRAQTKALAAAAKAAGRLVSFDCNYRPSLWGEDGYASAKPHYADMLRLADLVFMNEKDAMHILGMTTSRQDRRERLLELIPAVARTYDIPVIAGTHRTVHPDSTHSLQGYLYKEEAFAFSKKLSFPVYDRIGAGDAFASGILHGVLEDRAPERIVNFAAAAAMLAHTVSGDSPMASEPEVERALAEATDDIER
ncbi:sugar kinase [Paenibacillus antri]|uniref:Sugar kinase n=1 Tax=Paenibacillus antri TaxID=2582848 RepID=A0A5R9GIH3_9BACL|nr:sugar kinase [Paenibacillus antri]TLS54100.1 sugar kinase [Paenibacillus antri]